jgi:hypothetical protein
MGSKSLAAQFAIVVSLIIPAFFLAQAAQKSRTLVINGHPGEVAVIEKDSHAYVEIEALARLTNGSLSFNGNQIMLTLLAPDTPAPATTPPPPSGFTKDFIRAGIEEMAVIREWRSALKNAVQRGYPVTEDWIDGYQARAEQSLRLVSLAATTEFDKNAVQLLRNEFNNMKILSDRFVQANKFRTYVSPESLNNDPLDQKILNCARSLAAMAASGQFADDGSCH